jgi:hypothetical protein
MSKITHKGKKRNWAFVAYPESAPADLFEQLKISGLPIAVSPLHDRDFEADGQTPKKPHWHILLAYPGPTTYNAVKAFTARFNSPGPIPLEAVRGYYRYLTHKDNPEKAQYSESQIACFNGFSIYDFVEITRSEVDAIKSQLVSLIREQGIVEYADLLNHLQDSSLQNEFSVASNNTLFFNTYITSMRHKAESPKQRNAEEAQDLASEALD